MPSLTIAGHAFNVADDPNFIPGAQITLDEGVASTLQQVRRENLRNNFATHVKTKTKDLPEGGELSPELAGELQAALDEYASKYSFGVRRAGSPRVVRDPVEKESLKLARDDISAAYFAKHGERLKGDPLNEAAEKLLEARGEDYAKRARRNIRDREQAAEAVLAATGV